MWLLLGIFLYNQITPGVHQYGQQDTVNKINVFTAKQTRCVVSGMAKALLSITRNFRNDGFVSRKDSVTHNSFSGRILKCNTSIVRIVV